VIFSSDSCDSHTALYFNTQHGLLSYQIEDPPSKAIMVMILPALVVFLACLGHSEAGKPAPIVFVIQSQEGNFHRSLAERNKKSIINQWKKYVPEHVMDPPTVLLTHQLEDPVAYSAWTIFPLVELLISHLESEESVEWAALLWENTQVDLKNLNLAVEKYNFDPVGESLFLGRGLRDSELTIIHHFERSDLVYPDLESGIFLSRKLLMDLHSQINLQDKLFPSNFNIDSSYEFAKYLYRNGQGVSLKHIDEICAKKTSKQKCLTYFQQETSCLKTSQAVEMKEVLSRSFVAVKTCAKFHQERVEKVVKNTWGPLVTDLQYTSDQADPTIPTVSLPYTVNTETGHCNKTLAIMKQFLEQEEKDLLVVVDDDTILSVSRLASLLSCYTGEEGPFLLGQRYGYMVAIGHGYNYITGGGGIVMNREAVSLLSSCSCPENNTPDDMHLGMCARKAGVPILHSGRMFQARPTDYPSSLVSYRKPVSFHKHWEIDPIKVYEDYFKKADSKLKEIAKDEL